MKSDNLNDFQRYIVSKTAVNEKKCSLLGEVGFFLLYGEARDPPMPPLASPPCLPPCLLPSLTCLRKMILYYYKN